MAIVHDEHTNYASNGLNAVNYDDGTATIWSNNCTDSHIALPEYSNGSKVIGIEDGVFNNCSTMKTIYIPTSISTIGASAFKNCPSLDHIYYGGTKDQWNKINVKSNNDCLYATSKYYYSETMPTTSGNFWHYVNGVPTDWPK